MISALDPLRMAYDELLDDVAAEGVAHGVGPLDAEMAHDCGDVVRHGFDAQLSVDSGRTSVTTEFDRDHLPVTRQLREDRCQHRDADDAAVQQH